MMKLLLAVVAAGISCSTEPALADNFRCPNDTIVSTGDSISKVASKCDPPVYIFKREEPYTVDDGSVKNKTGTRTIYIEVQEWTYNQGFLHTLIFRNGILSEISFGGFAK